MLPRALLFVTLISLIYPVFASTNQFQNWYPEYERIFERLLRENCSNEFDFYLEGKRNWTEAEKAQWQGTVNTDKPAFAPANCVLESTSDWMKGNMASAAVVLGLTPSMLGALGPSVEEISSLFVIARKPVLGMLLAIGTPTLSPFRNIDYGRTVKDLQGPNDHMRLPHLFRKGFLRVLIQILEFLLAAAAIANNARNSYELGIKTTCVFAPHLWYLPLLWTFLGPIAHLLGALLLWLRVGPNKTYKETPWSVLLFCLLSLYLAGHVLFGTLLLSSLIFITVVDALGVVGRFLASVLVCRAILMYELALLRYRSREEHEGSASYQSVQATATNDSYGEYGADVKQRPMDSPSAV